jgi:glutamine amidotransferase
MFALITLCIRAAGGDVAAGIASAVRELAEDYELYSLNFLLASVGHVWAFRYPEHNPLKLLEHAHREEHETLVGTDSSGTLRMHADEAPMVLVASEAMDDDPSWEDVGVGELVHVGPDLRVERRTLLTEPPRHPMVLSSQDQASQAYERDVHPG